MDVLNSVFDCAGRLARARLLRRSTAGRSSRYTLVADAHHDRRGDDLPAPRPGAPRARPARRFPSHFFRFWLWLTTGMVTKEWVAIHRKHHAKCETVDDPHSPQTRGIKTVLLHRQRALSRRGQEPGDDRQVRPRHARRLDRAQPLQRATAGRASALMLIIDLLLFGAIGAAVWAVQMLWIPITAAGIINGIGHYWGYRNFEAPDAQPQRLALGHHHRRRRAAQQPPHLSDLGQAVGQAVRVRHRLGLHPRPRDARPGQGAQDARRSSASAPSSPWPTTRRSRRSSPTATR